MTVEVAISWKIEEEDEEKREQGGKKSSTVAEERQHDGEGEVNSFADLPAGPQPQFRHRRSFSVRDEANCEV